MTDSTASDDDWLIKEDEEVQPAGGAGAPDQRQWRVLIVDDDVDVHAVTRLALRNVSFKGRELELFSAYSGREAFDILRDTPDIALVLLDVVMETDHAGLDVVEFVRNELKDPLVRIILRTGQPGQAPELQVITRYDINDYRHKTELTRERLYTTVYTALSTYRDLVALDANRRGLEKVIRATADLFEADGHLFLALDKIEVSDPKDRLLGYMLGGSGMGALLGILMLAAMIYLVFTLKSTTGVDSFAFADLYGVKLEGALGWVLARGIRRASGRFVRTVGVPDRAPVGPFLRRFGGVLDRTDEVTGRLMLTPVKGGWKVFGFDVRREQGVK